MSDVAAVIIRHSCLSMLRGGGWGRPLQDVFRPSLPPTFVFQGALLYSLQEANMSSYMCMSCPCQCHSLGSCQKRFCDPN